MMRRILVLGANGTVARRATSKLLRDSDAHLTLYLRRAGRLGQVDVSRATIVEGDVLESAALVEAMRGQDVVFASLSGDLPAMAANIVEAMHAASVKRLIFISSMGIYGEVPGERYRSILDPYRDAAAHIESSDLAYTVLRPGWFTTDTRTHYHLTHRGEPFVGHDVSLEALATLIAELSLTPGLHVRESLGVSTL